MNALRLSHEFAAVLREQLSPEEVAEADHINGDGEASCASHDYLDANEAMDAAFERAFGRPARDSIMVEQGECTEAEFEADMALWNEAWSLAKVRGFAVSA